MYSGVPKRVKPARAGRGRGVARGLVDAAGEAEVEELDAGSAGACPGEEDVGRLDVAVHQRRAVRDLQRREDAARHAQRLAPADGLLAAEEGLEGLALQELHHAEEAAVRRLAHVVHADEPLVREAREGAGLPAEAGPDLGGGGLLLGDDLDGDPLAQVEVLRLVDDAAGAAPDLADEPVAGAPEHVALLRRRRQLGGRRLGEWAAQRRGQLGRQRAGGGAVGHDQARELAAGLGGLAGEESHHQGGHARAHAALAAGEGGSGGEQARQVRGGGARGQVAGVAVEGGELGDDGVELRGGADGGGDGRQILVVAGDRGHVHAGVALEEAAPGAQLPQHHAEGVQVDAGVAGVSVGHLGRDVAGLGEDHAGHRVAAAVQPARGAEVDDLALAPVADHHVLRRQIAVDDGQGLARGIEPLVDVGEGLRDQRPHGHRLGPADGLADLEGAGAHVAEAAALDVLDHGVGLAAAIVEGGVEHLGHARVLELRLHPRLVEEAGDEAGILGVLAADDLDDDGPLGALDAGGGGQEHLAHPAARQALEEEVAAERSGDVLAVPGVGAGLSRSVVLAAHQPLGSRHVWNLRMWDNVGQVLA